MTAATKSYNEVFMKKIIILAFCLLISFLTVSCSSEGDLPASEQQITDTVSSDEASVRDLFAMDTLMTLKAYGEDREGALSEAALKITELEKLFSATDEESEIWKASHSGGKTVSVSEETAEVLSFMLDISFKTNGALDPTVCPVVREWGFTTGKYKIPEQDVIDSLLQLTGYEKVKLNGNELTLPEGMMLDLGASAKGYTGDVVSDIFRRHGVSSAVISLGGNVQTVGSRPDGTDWKVAVRDPLDESEQLCIVSVSDKAVVTSGNYERYFTGEDGKRYCHIIDPSDGYPADNGIASVTVISESGILCDCLSTALFVMGKDKALEYQKKHGGFEMIIVSSENEVTYTEGLEGKIELVK
jgi:thiamine biosynthesis lipoprotein